jgi:hypothetical protein
LVPDHPPGEEWEPEGDPASAALYQERMGDHLECSTLRLWEGFYPSHIEVPVSFRETREIVTEVTGEGFSPLPLY